MGCEFRFRPSRAYLALTTLVHVGGIVCVAAAHAPTPALVAGALVLAASLLLDLRGTAMRSGRRAVVGAHSGAQGWTLLLRDGGAWGPGRVVAGRAGTLGVWLVLRARDGERRALAVPCDAVDGDDARRLRVYARADLARGAPR